MPLRCLLCLLYLITEKIDAVLPLCRSASLLSSLLLRSACLLLLRSLPLLLPLSAAFSCCSCCTACRCFCFAPCLPACFAPALCLPALCIRFAFALLRSCCLLLLSLCLLCRSCLLLLQTTYKQKKINKLKNSTNKFALLCSATRKRQRKKVFSFSVPKAESLQDAAANLPLPLLLF